MFFEDIQTKSNRDLMLFMKEIIGQEISLLKRFDDFQTIRNETIK